MSALRRVINRCRWRRGGAGFHKLTLKHLDVMLEAMDFSCHVILCIHLQLLPMCKLARLARGVDEALAKMNNLVTEVNQFTFLRIHLGLQSLHSLRKCTKCHTHVHVHAKRGCKGRGNHQCNNHPRRVAKCCSQGASNAFRRQVPDEQAHLQKLSFRALQAQSSQDAHCCDDKRIIFPLCVKRV